MYNIVCGNRSARPGPRSRRAPGRPRAAGEPPGAAAAIRTV